MKSSKVTETKSLGFIGGGRITRIILTGFCRAGKMPSNVVVSDMEERTLSHLNGLFPDIRVIHDGNDIVAAQDIIFLALRTPDYAKFLNGIRPVLNPKSILVSFAPKLRLVQISSSLGGFDRLVRMIPNAPSIINKGYNPIVFAQGVNDEERKALLDLFKLLGESPEVAEDSLETYAILTAMGPTYFWPQLDELRLLANAFGLSDGETSAAIPAMISGAVGTMFSSQLSNDEIMDLIPGKPLADDETQIRDIFRTKLTALHERMKV